jgi:hypothetical protein
MVQLNWGLEKTVFYCGRTAKCVDFSLVLYDKVISNEIIINNKNKINEAILSRDSTRDNYI